MTKDFFDFTGKALLITGGSTGIGRATALAFARHGARIVIGDLNESAGNETVELIKKEGAGVVLPVAFRRLVSRSADREVPARKGPIAYGRKGEELHLDPGLCRGDAR